MVDHLCTEHFKNRSNTVATEFSSGYYKNISPKETGGGRKADKGLFRSWYKTRVAFFFFFNCARSPNILLIKR